jgi:hypothetical protein
VTAARDVIGDQARDRVMARAQSARTTQKRTWLWRSSEARAPHRAIALGFAALIATGGLATGATASSGLLGGLKIGSITNQIGLTSKAPPSQKSVKIPSKSLPAATNAKATSTAKAAPKTTKAAPKIGSPVTTNASIAQYNPPQCTGNLITITITIGGIRIRICVFPIRIQFG